MENISDILKYGKTKEEFLEQGILIYNNKNTIIFFNNYEVLNSGFIKPLTALGIGRIPLGSETGHFVINPDLIKILHPNQNFIFKEDLINDTFIRYYFEDKEYEANDGLAPIRIKESYKIGKLIILELTPPK